MSLPLAVFKGTKVVVSDINHRGPIAAVVEKVGRKNFYLQGWHGQAFDLKTGQIKDSYGHATVYTLEGWAWKQQVEAARTWLRSHGVDVFRVDGDRKVVAIYDAIKDRNIFP